MKHSATLAALLLALSAGQARAQRHCEVFWVTGYSSADYPGRTASGVPTRGAEWTIAAAHPRFPFGTVLHVEGVGRVTVQDRGLLGVNDLDVLTRTRAEAYALTGSRRVCVEARP